MWFVTAVNCSEEPGKWKMNEELINIHPEQRELLENEWVYG